MATLFPVLFLAFGPTVACAAAAAFLAQGQTKLGGADGALREDHSLSRRQRGAALAASLAMGKRGQEMLAPIKILANLQPLSSCLRLSFASPDVLKGKFKAHPLRPAL